MKRLKQNRVASFIAVALVYVFATAVGVLVYRALTLDWWLSLLIADAAVTVATFIFSLIFKNASAYDPYWSVQPPVILVGLWKYSRHPNYLGELLMWWGVAMAVVCAAPSAWYLASGAVANTLLFLVVSIPMADKRQSRKECFAEYKKQTRMLLPIKK